MNNAIKAQDKCQPIQHLKLFPCLWFHKERITTVRGKCSLSSIELEWNNLPKCEKNCFTFNDFIHFDDDLSIMEIQMDEDIRILAQVDNNENIWTPGQVDDDEDFFLAMSTKEVKCCINRLYVFPINSIVNDNVILAFVTVGSVTV